MNNYCSDCYEFNLDEELIDQYTSGECHILAFELYKHLEISIIILSKIKNSYDFVHVAAKINEDLIVDIEGIQCIEHFKEKWEEQTSSKLFLNEIKDFKEIHKIVYDSQLNNINVSKLSDKLVKYI